MARGDAIHRTTARNARMKDADIGNAQAHNERQKESYVNQDIVTERTPMNVHFKSPSSDYTAMFDDMVSSGTISTRGLKADAEKFGELIFDVNSAYFFNHGGYEFAKQFYADAYKAAIKIVGGEQYILSAVMHADERNRAMSDTLGQDVYHYHFHVVYIPIVEKQILWSKRCKDIHLFVSRDKVFEKESVLQETIIIKAKKMQSKPNTITITTTQSNADFSNRTVFEAPYSTVVNGDESYVYLMTNTEKVQTLNELNRWTDTLPDIGLKRKTGLTVDFRNREALR